MPYRNPPQIPAAALSTWEHSSADYYWHPGAQQAQHPHLHLNGSTVNGVVTINFLKYTTGGQGGNITIQFTQAGGYQAIADPIGYQQAYNIKIEDINNSLLTV